MRPRCVTGTFRRDNDRLVSRRARHAAAAHLARSPVQRSNANTYARPILGIVPTGKKLCGFHISWVVPRWCQTRTEVCRFQCRLARAAGSRKFVVVLPANRPRTRVEAKARVTPCGSVGPANPLGGQAPRPAEIGLGREFTYRNVTKRCPATSFIDGVRPSRDTSQP